MKKEYTNGNITITWEPEHCIHSTNCFKGLPRVFNPKNRPWIKIDEADDERIIEQIKRCPSGALGYFRNDTGMPDEVNSSAILNGSIVAIKAPKDEILEKGKPYAWCACGRSEKQPFCDGTHIKTDLKPLIFKPKETGKAYLCQCKQTGTPPYCDGTHNRLA